MLVHHGWSRVIDRILLSLVLCSVWKMNMNNHQLKNDRCGEINFAIVMSTATLSSQQISLLLRNRPNLFGKTRIIHRTNLSDSLFAQCVCLFHRSEYSSALTPKSILTAYSIQADLERAVYHTVSTVDDLTLSNNSRFDLLARIETSAYLSYNHWL